MKLLMLRNLKLILSTCFLSINVFVFAQEDRKHAEKSVAAIFKEASSKYQEIFNYDYKEVIDIKFLDTLPNTISQFKSLLLDYSGLELEPFEDKIWIVKKNYTHHIQFVDSEGDAIQGVGFIAQKDKSNRFGNVFINVSLFPKNYQFKFGNYDLQEINIEKTSPKKIQVVVTQFVLENVVINNLYVNGVSLDANKHIRVKTKRIPLLAGQVQQDAFISLLNLPQISNPSESITELNIKGGVNDQNLVLWNGIKLFQNAHFFGLFSAFNDNLIETITVVDNATPAKFGNALSGIITLDFDPMYSTKNSYGIGVNALSGHAFVRQKLNATSEFSFALQRSFTNFFKTPTFESFKRKVFNDTEIELSENQSFSDNVIRNEVFYYQDAQFQLKKKINEKLELNLQGIWFENDLNYNEKIPDSSNKNSTFNNLNAAIGLNAKYAWNSKNEISFLYNFSKHKSQGNNNTFTGNLNTFQSNAIDSYFFQTIWTKKNSGGTYNFGLDFDGTRVGNKFNNETTSAFLNLLQISNIYSFFGDFALHKNRWRIYTGLRNVYYQRDDAWRLEPRVNISFKLSKIFDLSLRGEFKSQNLKQIIDLDQNFLGIEKRRWLLSGENESPLQESYQIETLFQFNIKKLGGYASFYYRRLNGLSSNDQRFQNENQFNSFQYGTSQIVGSNLHIYYKTKHISSWISIAYLNDKTTVPGKSFIGNNNLDYKITWGNSFIYKRWNFSFSCVIHDGLPYTDLRSNIPLETEEILGFNSIDFAAPNGSKLPNYFRLDSSLQYHYQTKNSKHLKFSLGIINLTDRENILRKNYRLNRVNTNQIQEITALGLGFTPNIGFSFYF